MYKGKNMMDKILTFFSINKDALTAMGIVFTFLVSIISLYFSIRNNKAVHYVNSITKNRIEWIAKLRELSVDFINSCEFRNHKPLLDENGYIDDHNIEHFKSLCMQIKLMLNYADEFDREIMNIADTIVNLEEKYYDMVNCISHYLDDDGIIDFEKYTIEKVLYEEPYVQDFVLRFCEMKNIQVDKQNRLSCIRTVEEYISKIKENKEIWNELNICFLNEPERLIQDIEKNSQWFNRCIQIYLKCEWNRVKYESQGKQYEKATQEFDRWELEQKYDNPNYMNKTWKRFYINTKAKVKKIIKAVVGGVLLFVLIIAIAMLV